MMHDRRDTLRQFLLPLFFGGLVLVLTLVVWRGVSEQERRGLGLAVQEYADQTASRIEGRTTERILPYKRMAQRWMHDGGENEQAWRADARQYLADHPELQALEWVGTDSRIVWVEPLAGNEAAVGRVLNFEGQRAEALERARSTHELALTRVIELVQGGAGLLLFYPLRIDGEPAGFMVFVIRPAELLEQVLGEADDRYELAVYDGEEALYRHGEGAGLGGQRADSALEVAGVRWRVEVRPTKKLAGMYRTKTPWVVLLSGLLLSGAVGVLAYIGGVAHRRRAELAEQSDQTQAILDRLPAMVWYKDTKNNILRTNKTAADGLGTTPEAMAGRPTADFYPDTAELFYQGDLEVMREKVPRLGVVEPIDTDQGRRYVQTDKLPVMDSDGEVTGIIVVATDITHVKEAEAQARSASERFEAFMRNAPEMKWAVDEAGRYVFVNPAYEALMDVRSETCLGELPSDVLAESTTAAFLSVVTETNSAALSRGEPIKFEVSVPVNDRVYPLLVTKFVFRDAAGKRLVGGSALDMTAVKEAERLLAKHNKDLETLLYVISHDLREPLRAITNFSDIVRREFAEGLGERGEGMLARVVGNAQRLEGLLSGVLMLSRVQRADAVDEPVETRAVVDDVVQALSATIEETGARISVIDPLPAMRAEPLWLRQAMQNLLANALKFTRPGEPPEIEVAGYHAEPEEGVVGLVVRDRGPGVPAEQREKVFQLFQRGVGRDVPGTGTGLAIVAQVAQRYGGRAWVRGREGGGAEFILTIRQ